MKAAIYARVSKKTGQETANQLVELRRYAKAQNWEVVEYIDHETGKHAMRDAFGQLFQDASRRKFDVVLVWALDRFSREGVQKTFAHLDRLKAWGVHIESYTEPFFRTMGPAGELLMAILAWVAKQEHQRISDRTKAGLARARDAGRIGGRRPKVFSRDRALELRSQNPPASWRAISRELGVSVTSIREALGGRHGVRKTSSQKPGKRVANRRPAKG